MLINIFGYVLHYLFSLRFDSLGRIVNSFGHIVASNPERSCNFISNIPDLYTIYQKIAKDFFFGNHHTFKLNLVFNQKKERAQNSQKFNMRSEGKCSELLHTLVLVLSDYDINFW
uniref:Uncharacterized protein n=1 Tax=Cacopsylla melanoneura TaxID=428564 RepID=A0A8D9AWP5_9HEMI